MPYAENGQFPMQSESPSMKPAFDAAPLLARVWKKSLPVLQERLLSLESAALAGAQGTLSSDSRQEAADVAHKLAGSLGMFGYQEGTEIARQMEMLLEPNAPAPDGAQLCALAAMLRAALPLSD